MYIDVDGEKGKFGGGSEGTGVVSPLLDNSGRSVPDNLTLGGRAFFRFSIGSDVSDYSYILGIQCWGIGGRSRIGWLDRLTSTRTVIDLTRVHWTVYSPLPHSL
jgi:hypothetical protein